MEKYDLCIIGAGPAGYAAAMRAVDFKKKVLVVEKSRIGGTGIHNGALSSKTFWEYSRAFATLRNRLKPYGIEPPVPEFRKVKSDVDAAVSERRHIIEDHIEKIRKAYPDLITIKKGKATIVDQHLVRIETDLSETTIEADFIAIATGSKPRLLSHIPIDEKIILTSDGIEGLDHFPKAW